MVYRFSVSASKVGTYCVFFKNAAANRTLVKEFTISAINTYEHKTIRFTHDASGTWLYNNAIGVIVGFSLGAGTAFHTNADTWNSGNFMSTSAQVNLADTVGATFHVTGVLMTEDNEGQTRLPDFVYAGRDIFEELQLSQRYFEKSYNTDVAPGTITNLGAKTLWLGTATSVTPTLAMIFKVTKRAASSVIVYNPATGAVGSANDRNGNILRALSGADQIGFNEANISITSAYSPSASYLTWHFTADAEL